jgi:hypothetical protein
MLVPLLTGAWMAIWTLILASGHVSRQYTKAKLKSKVEMHTVLPPIPLEYNNKQLWCALELLPPGGNRSLNSQDHEC